MSASRLPAPLLHALLLVGAVFALYQPVLNFGFVWDDKLFVVKNPAVQNWDRLGEAFTSPQTTWSADAEHTLPAWRPLRNLSYLIDYGIFKLNPIGWHLTNILLHAASAVLLLFLIRRLAGEGLQHRAGLSGRTGWICLLAAAFWAVHPVQTEVVAWIKSRDDLVATPLLFASLLLGLARWRGSALASWTLFLLALLSKENAIVGAAIFPMLAWLMKRRLSARDIALTVGLIGTSVVFLAARQLLLGQTAQADWPGNTPAQTLLTMLYAFARYVRLIVWPWPPTVMSADYDGFPMVQSWLHPGALAGAALLAGLVAVALASFKKRPIIAVGIGFFLLALAPFANIIPMMQVMAERFLYIPLAGAAIILLGAAPGIQGWVRQDIANTPNGTRNPNMAKKAGLSEKSDLTAQPIESPNGNLIEESGSLRSFGDSHFAERPTPGRAARVWSCAAIILLAVLAWQTRQRLPVWQDEVSLFTANAKANPTSWRPANSLINSLILDGQTSRALTIARQSMAKWPNDPDILRTAAVAHMVTRQDDAAVSITQRAIQLQPNDPRASETLAKWRKMIGN